MCQSVCSSCEMTYSPERNTLKSFSEGLSLKEESGAEWVHVVSPWYGAVLTRLESDSCLRHQATNKCLTAQGTEEGSSLLLEEENSENVLQSWIIDELGHIINAGGNNLVLALRDTSDHEGVHVAMRVLENKRNKKWLLREDGHVVDRNYMRQIILSDNELAVANDGTQASYFLQTEQTGEKKMLIFFQGGGLCVPNYPHHKCKKRCEHDFETDNDLDTEDSFENDYERSLCTANKHRYEDARENGGLSRTIWNLDPEINPAFHDFNKVFVPYISSDTYIGRRDNMGNYTEGYHFHGKYVVEAITQHLIEHTWITQADKVVLMGASAGALGAEANCDFIADLIHQHNPDVDMRCISDSGSMYPVGVHIQYCNPQAFMYEGYRIWDARPDDSCRAENEAGTDDDPCFLLNTAFRYIDTPLLAIMSSQDTTMRWCYTDEESFWQAWREELSALARLMLEEKPSMGMYMANCPFHVSSSTTWDYMQVPLLDGEPEESIYLKNLIYNFVYDAGPKHAIDNMDVQNENCHI